MDQVELTGMATSVGTVVAVPREPTVVAPARVSLEVGVVAVDFIIIAREVDKLQAEVLKRMWDKIGVRATIQAVERAALNQLRPATSARVTPDGGVGG